MVFSTIWFLIYNFIRLLIVVSLSRVLFKLIGDYVPGIRGILNACLLVLQHQYNKLPSITGKAASTNSLDRNALPTMIPVIRSLNHVSNSLAERQTLSNYEKSIFVSIKAKQKSSGAEGNSSEDRRPRNVLRLDQQPISFLDAVSQPVSILSNISTAIYCSTGVLFKDDQTNRTGRRGKDAVKDCGTVSIIKPGVLYGSNHARYAIFAFHPLLEAVPRSACGGRALIYKHFQEVVWNRLLAQLNSLSANQEIFFVGYESGGALATLAANMALAALSKSDGKPMVLNEDNRIKVVTWDELDLFSHEARMPLLQRNHLKFQSPLESRTEILQSSGGAEELNSFSALGTNVFLRPEEFNEAQILNASKEADDLKSVDILDKFFPDVKLRPDPSTQDRCMKLLSLHLTHLRHFREAITKHNPQASLLDASLNEPRLCALGIAQVLSGRSLFNDPNQISCRFANYNLKTKRFRVYCSYKQSRGGLKGDSEVSVQFLTFDAIAGTQVWANEGNSHRPFMEEVVEEVEDVEAAADETEAALASRKETETVGSKSKSRSKRTAAATKKTRRLRYCGQVPADTKWSKCLYKLFSPQISLSPLLPHAFIEDQIFPNCSFINFGNIRSIHSSTLSSAEGCYIMSPHIAQDIFNLFQTDAEYFYRLINPDSMAFIPECQKELYHVSLKPEEFEKVRPLQEQIVRYMSELLSTNPLADDAISIWQARNTPSFHTLKVWISESFTPSILSNRELYADDFENRLVRCLSSPSFNYRDCTNPHNRWVPEACPAMCADPAAAPFCRQVKNCYAAGFFISISGGKSPVAASPNDAETLHRTFGHDARFKYLLYQVQASNLSIFSSAASNTSYMTLFKAETS